MTWLILMNIILVTAALIGMWMISDKNKMGFVVFTFVEISMFYIGWSTKNYGLCAAAVLYFFMNCVSYYKWSR